MSNKIFKKEKLPFIEIRYIHDVRSCEKKHSHKELVFTVIKQGSIDIIFENKTDSLKPNELSIINPQEIHCAQLHDNLCKDCYVMYLDKKWMSDLQNSLFEDNIECLLFNTSLVKDKRVHKTFVSLCERFFSNDTDSIEKEENLIEFILSLLKQYTSKTLFKKTDNKNSLQAKKIEKYLLENIEEDILLEDISQYMNLSIVHILRIFKKEFGLPIHSYLINKKVHIAKDLLAKNIAISEVAQRSGFFDQSHLNRSFKRVFQLTPKEYQKNIFS